MRFTLPSKKEVKLYFKHETNYVDKNGHEYWKEIRRKNEKGHWEQLYVCQPIRSTIITLEFVTPDIKVPELTCRSTITCHTTDQFNKELGRKLAFKKLLAEWGLNKAVDDNDPYYLDKKDRDYLWSKVLFSKYHKSQRKKKIRAAKKSKDTSI